MHSTRGHARVTTATATRVAVVMALIAVAFVAGYKVREFDPQFSAWLSRVEGEDGPPEPGTRLRFDATAYCKGTTTASGVAVRVGVAAADPVLLPVGSVVNVATGDERYNGIYAVLDTGPKVQGRHLDLYIWNCNEALAFGRRGVDLTVMRLGWDPQASAPTLIDRLFRGREARRRARAPIPPPSPETSSPGPSAAEIGPPAPADTAPPLDVLPVDTQAAPAQPAVTPSSAVPGVPVTPTPVHPPPPLSPSAP